MNFMMYCLAKFSHNKEQDELSIQVAIKVETRIKKAVEIILDSLPVLPASLSKIVEHIGA